MKRKVKNLSSHRVRHNLPFKPASERAETKLKQKFIENEGWIDQLRHSFQEETPHNWMPAAYQALYQHTLERKWSA